MDKEEKNVRDAVTTAWEMFSQTGNISYYLLYTKLKGKRL